MHFEIAEKLIKKASDMFGTSGVIITVHLMKYGESKIKHLIKSLIFVDVEKLIFDGMTFYPDFSLEKLEEMKDKPIWYMKILERTQNCIMKIPRELKLCPKCGTVVDTQINEIWCVGE